MSRYQPCNHNNNNNNNNDRLTIQNDLMNCLHNKEGAEVNILLIKMHYLGSCFGCQRPRVAQIHKV